MAGMVLLRDAAEDVLGLPRRPYEVPLILYDRMLTRAGELSYPSLAIWSIPGFRSSKAMRYA
jgi:spore coat protein A, manganese oxidase